MRGRLRGALVGACALVASLAVVPGAGAAVYPDTPSGSISEQALGSPVAVDVDSASGNVYVGTYNIAPSIRRFDSSGDPLSPATMGDGFDFGIAVEQGGDSTVYTYSLLTSSINAFTSAGGAFGSPFPFSVTAPENLFAIGSDTAGNIYLPLETAVAKYTSAAVAGTPITFSCDGAECASTALEEPIDVATDSTGRLYVADTGNDRVIRFDADGSNPVIFATGAAGSVAVDISNNQVFVGGDDGSGYHVTAYDSSGNEVDDFGLGSISSEPDLLRSKIAVNSSSHVVYVTQFAIGNVLTFTPIPSPTVSTGAASSIAATTATLNGTVNPSEVETDECRFDYTTKADFEANVWANAQEAACSPNPLNSSSDVAVSAAVSGLTHSTDYVFRVVEQTEGGTAEGDAEEFTTAAPAKPKATTEAASGIGQTGATLNAKVDAEGNDADCSFEYGATASYGTTVDCSIDPVTGTANTAVSAALSGLSSGTTYHYRVVATNAGGTTNGADMTFTTASPPPPPPPTGGGSPGGATSTPAAPAPTPPTTKKPLKCKKGFKKKTVKGKQKCVKVKKKKKK